MTMFGHLTEETLMDVVDGTAAPRAREHAEACPSCRTRVSEAAEVWGLAESSDVPEPPPLYWETFRRQVDRRIQSEGRARRIAFRLLVPLAATAGIVLAFTGSPSRVPVPSGPVAASVLPAWSALPPADDDPGFEVLRAVATGNTDLASSYERGNVQDLLSDLSDDESQALADRLRTAGAGAL